MVTAIVADQVSEAVRGALRGGEVRLRVDRPITVDYLYELTRQFEGLWFEAGRGGELVISGAAGGWSGDVGAELSGQVRGWTRGRGRGRTRDAQSGYDPPGGRPMVPDVSWLSDESVAAAERLRPDERRRGYFRLVPDFVIEVRSPSQELKDQREKMEDWAVAKVPLGVLVDPETQTVWLYRPDEDGFVVEEFLRPSRVPCEPEMPGLVLEFDLIWTFPWE